MKKLLMLLMALVLVSACSTKEPEKKPEKEVADVDKDKDREKEDFDEEEDEYANVPEIKVGERFVVKNKDGSDGYAITITKAGLTDYRPGKNTEERYFAVEFMYENIGFNHGGETSVSPARVWVSSEEEPLDDGTNFPGESGIDIPDFVEPGESHETVRFYHIDDSDKSKKFIVTHISEYGTIMQDPSFKIIVVVD